MPDRPVNHRTRHRVLGWSALTMSIALLLGACSSNNPAGQPTLVSSAPVKTMTTSSEPTTPSEPVALAQARVAAAEEGQRTAEEALTTAHQSFCGTAKDYVEILDRYGRVFTDSSATVGDVQTLGADLVEPRAEVVVATDAVVAAKDGLADAQQELVDAKAALADAIASASGATASSTTPTTVATTSLVPVETVERVQLAETDFASAARDIDADTALVEAGAAYNSAAFALQITWLNLLNESGCFSDEVQAEALAQLTAYTTALQTDLQRAGYDPGPIDGVYGPETVAAVQQLQTQSGLPVTGFVDEATARALQAKLEALGQAEATQTAALQSTLTLIGFWTGPIDGVWTDELTQALLDLQNALGVPPSGEVDVATIAAFQQKRADLIAAGTSATTATQTWTATETTTATARTTATTTATSPKTTTSQHTPTETETETEIPETPEPTDLPEPTEEPTPTDG